MKLKHDMNIINSGGHTQHRLMLGKREILAGLHRTGSDADLMAGECLDLYVTEQKEKQPTTGDQR